MGFEMINTIERHDLSRIMELIGKRFSIYAGDNISNMYLAVRLQVDTDLYLMNVPTAMQDKDEYPIFSLTTTPENEYEWEELHTGVLEKVSLVRDEVYWKREGVSEWKVTQDVGIKFYFDNSEVLIMSVDSIAGFVKANVNSKVEIPNTQEDMIDYWKMKVDDHEFDAGWKRSEVFL